MVMQERIDSPVRWPILGVAFLLAFVMWASMFCVPPMEYILKESLHLTHAHTILLYSAPMLALAGVAIPAGIMADRIGFRKAAGIGASIIAVGSILRATVTNPFSLLVFTFIIGVGLGLSYPNLFKLVSAWSPRERAGVATGVFAAGLPSGGAVALATTMPLVFPIAKTFQGVFFIWSIPAVAAAILWWAVIREPPRSKIHNEAVSRGATPFSKVLRSKNLWLIGILQLLSEFFMMSWLGWAPALIRLKGATPELAASITSITIWAGIPTVLLIPRLSYRSGVRKPFIWLPSVILGAIAVGAIHITLPVGWLLMAVVGIVGATRFVTILALPIEMMPKEQVGVASGLVLSISYIGGGLGPFVSGHILDLTGSLNPPFLMLAGISMATAVIALSLPETGPRARVQRSFQSKLSSQNGAKQ
jgi:cyanate permease